MKYIISNNILSSKTKNNTSINKSNKTKLCDTVKNDQLINSLSSDYNNYLFKLK